MLNDILRILRIANDLSITKLSRLSNISCSYISEIEKGCKNPSLKTLESFAKVFNMSVNQILFFEIIASENGYMYPNILTMILEYYVENNHVFNTKIEKKKALV